MSTPPSVFVPTSTQDANSFLLKSKAVLTIDAIERMQLYCTRFNLPTVSTRSVPVPTPFATLKMQGDHIVYEDLIVEFLVRQDLSNWIILQEWLVGLTRPESFKQAEDRELTYSDGTLYIMDASNNVTNTFRFINLCIEQLHGIEFEVQSDPDPIKTNVIFTYDYYKRSKS